MVLGHHSSLAYTTFAHFDKQNLARSTAPIVDVTRWRFFDYAENFNDVFFMSLMFFVSGLFVYPALRRHGTFGFMRDRLLRLGVPFAFAVVILMPIAYYASWQLTGLDTGFFDFYRRLAAAGFAVGPPWFIWLLLFFDVVLAFLLVPFKRTMPVVERLMSKLRDHSVATFSALLCLAAVAYIPLLFRYGFGTWTNLITSPFSFQVARIVLYFLWFMFGFLVGAPGLNSGLLARDGSLVRHWPLWILGCIVAYNLLCFVPKWPVVHHFSGTHQRFLEALLWVASCTASSFGFLALFRGIELHSRSWMNSLTRSAYVMYLVHYVFVTWTQRLVLNRPFHAGLKFLFVFLATVFLSWLTAQAVLRIPKLKTIL
jgi:Acyltransferase family